MFAKVLIILAMVIGQGAFAKQLQRGKYLVQIMGCNDCHTPQYGMKGGAVPESQWLIGSEVGFNGPWGTTYPSNLRQMVQDMDEATWVTYIKNFKARPPMPSYDTNKISHQDLKDMYAFVRSLGPATNNVPQYLPPGEKPRTPFIDFNVQLPK